MQHSFNKFMEMLIIKLLLFLMITKLHIVKASIQFNSNGQAGEITFQIRYYGSSYNNSTLNFLFFSRVISGKIGTYFDHALLDVDDVQDKNQIIYFEDVNINDNKLKGLAAPSEDKDGANKKHVDDQIKAIPAVDTSDLLKLDGSRAMTGTLNLGGQRVENIKAFIEDDSSQSASDVQKYDVVNWGKIHEIRGDLKREINQVASDALNRKSPDPMLDPIDMNNNKIKGIAEPTDLKDGANKKYVDDQIKAIPAVDTSDLLKLDGSRAMTGNLQMGDNFITNVKDPLPSNSHYAATVNFVNKTVSDNNATISTLIDSKIDQVEDLNIKSAKQENVFSFVMDDDLFKEDDSDITKVGKVNKDFYDIHKETYQFNISYDSSIGYYSSRLGIVLKPLDLGEYTFVFEMYYDKNKANKDLVVVEAQAVPLNISKKYH